MRIEILDIDEAPLLAYPDVVRSKKALLLCISNFSLVNGLRLAAEDGNQGFVPEKSGQAYEQGYS